LLFFIFAVVEALAFCLPIVEDVSLYGQQVEKKVFTPKNVVFQLVGVV